MPIKPKKSLGQNFLADRNIREKIVKAAEFNLKDAVLEIGPGRGEITSLLLPKVKKLYALEIDRSLCDVLKETLGNHSNLELINKDILKFDLFSIPGQIKVVGNIPYYISTPIIEHLFEYREKIEAIFMTVQKEFAKRMSAAPGSRDYSSLSCFVQYYCEPKVLFNIKRGSFYPVPNVDSSFIRLKIRKEPAVKVSDEKRLFVIIRAAFNQRRKTLRNSLEGIIADEALEKFYRDNHISKGIRPESLSLKDFAALSEIAL